VEANAVFRFVPYRDRATAYVVDTVQTVLHYFSLHEGFEAAMIATVNQGDDADTTGALLGMLAGARCGAAQLPRRWLERLQSATVQAITGQTRGLLDLAGTLAPNTAPARSHLPPPSPKGLP
jgi:ADP-ribosyl-[dinitrogen reductase] hydrolase